MLAPRTIAAERDAIIEEFSTCSDWTERYERLIELGRGLPGMCETQQSEADLIESCIARVWIRAERHGGAIVFRADSDTLIVRGLIALLLRVYSGRRPDEILAEDPGFLDRIELGAQLSRSRVDVVAGMVDRIKAAAACPPPVAALGSVTAGNRRD